MSPVPLAMYSSITVLEMAGLRKESPWWMARMAVEALPAPLSLVISRSSGAQDLEHVFLVGMTGQDEDLDRGIAV